MVSKFEKQMFSVLQNKTVFIGIKGMLFNDVEGLARQVGETH